ncbi:unnamed protein product [Candidula unifasciata]|uniref:Thioredoxin domain-containing protein n=1 Tax=Candidula unifasciata TaxID=100452 RepID=A0A8S3ZX91_9EUPU|nr:unnamed protein product [Candidula unifasciata]
MPKFNFCGLRPRKPKKLPKYDDDFDVFCKWNDDENTFNCVVPLDKEDFKDVIKEADLALIFFFHPELPDMEKGRQNFYQAALHSQRKNHIFGSLNCLEEPEICCKVGIETVPTMKLFAGRRVAGEKDPTAIDYMSILKWMDSFRI